MSKNVKDDVCFRVFFGIHLPTLWIWKGQVVGMSKHWGFHGGTPIAGWFISWNILLKWMMWGYPHGCCIQATVLLLLKICATCVGQCSFPTYHCPFNGFTVQIYVKSPKYGPIFPTSQSPWDPRHGLLHWLVGVALAVFQQTKSLNNGRLLHFKWYLPFARMQRGETRKGHAHHEAHIVTWGLGICQNDVRWCKRKRIFGAVEFWAISQCFSKGKRLGTWMPGGLPQKDLLRPGTISAGRRLMDKVLRGALAWWRLQWLSLSESQKPN